MDPGEPAAERETFNEVVLAERLRQGLRRLNGGLPEEAIEEALRKVQRVATPSVVQTNRAFRKLLRDGVDVEHARPNGSTKHDKAWLVAFSDERANDWLAVNQFTVIEGQHDRRPYIVVFVNGLSLALIELRNTADEDATIWSAQAQLQTYKSELPGVLAYNAALVLGDSLQARMGSLTANQEWFKVWRTMDGEGDPTCNARQAITVMLEKHGVACDMLHCFNWAPWTTGKPAERLALIQAGQEHILEQEDGKKRWMQVISDLSRAFALCAASDEATAIREDVSFIQALQAAFNKQSGASRKTPEQIDAAVCQLVSKAITTQGQVIDVFTAAGLPRAGHQHPERQLPRRGARPEAPERRR